MRPKKYKTPMSFYYLEPLVLFGIALYAVGGLLWVVFTGVWLLR